MADPRSPNRASSARAPLLPPPPPSPPIDFVGPQEPAPAPPPLTGWRYYADQAIDSLVSGVKGLTGLGDQGPAGPTKTNAAALIGAALPIVGGAKKLRQGIRAYHGSGADFDRFDFSHVGTGQGAQSYGHGGYFAEAEPVALGYRKELSGLAPEGWAQQFPETARGYINGMVGDVASGKVTPEQAATYIRNANAVMRGHAPQQLADEIAKAAQYAKGRMYEVNLKVDPKELLDWDAPLAHQPEPIQRFGSQLGWHPSATGANVYYEMGRPKLSEVGSLREYLGTPDPEVASRLLTQEGVPGIRYLDQHSRVRVDVPEIEAEMRRVQRQLDEWSQRTDPRAPQMRRDFQLELANLQNALAVERSGAKRTRNYVMFPGTEGLIDILRKYGLVPPIAGGAALEALGRERTRDQVGTPPPVLPPQERR